MFAACDLELFTQARCDTRCTARVSKEPKDRGVLAFGDQRIGKGADQRHFIQKLCRDIDGVAGGGKRKQFE